MNIMRISSRRNTSIVEAVKLLNDTAYRKQLGKIAAEGTKLFYDALTSGADIDTIIATEHLETELSGVDVNRLIIVPDNLFSSISTQKSPQGLLFFCNRPDTTAGSSAETISFWMEYKTRECWYDYQSAAAFDIKGVIYWPMRRPIRPQSCEHQWVLYFAFLFSS